MSSTHRVLFVSNGNGEAAIADRIAREIRALAPDVGIDHLALVGESRSRDMNDVGPQRVMPSGGLIAMGNVRNIARDVRKGLLGLTIAQQRFLRRARGTYDAAVAVGDVYALLMTLAARAPTVYVGTAKSVRVAPYGPLEERVLRRAAAIFVRDEPTAERLRSHGVDARAPGNVIVDLFASGDDARADETLHGFDPAVAIFPGSRTSAYADATFLCDVLRRCASAREHIGGALSIAPFLDVDRFAEGFARNGWTVERRDDALIPFDLRDARGVRVRAWRGEIGPLLARVQLVIGQAGTANEAAAAAGVPVVAFERGKDRKTAWYRMRQHGLLGDALAVFDGDPARAAAQVSALLDDPPRAARMGETGRIRMGPAGGAAAIAATIVRGLA